VSDDFPPGTEFLRGLLGDLLKLLGTGAPVQWDLARALATSAASGDEPSEANPDPVERIAYEELQRVAELHVAEATGMAVGAGARTVELVTRVEFARRSLERWRPLAEDIARAIGQPPTPPAGEATADRPSLAALMGQWSAVLMPAMLGLQLGSAIGRFARRAVGQYDLPLPNGGSSELLVVAANVRDLARDWSLPAEDLRMWVCIRDLAYDAVLSRPHVARRLHDLLVRNAERFRPDPRALEERLENLEAADFPALLQVLGDPVLLGGQATSEEAHRARTELEALVSVVAGYAEHVTRTVADRLIGPHAPIAEAMRRRRIDRAAEERAAEMLFGLRVGQPEVERGLAFVEGVLARSGEDELARLWVVERHLPTPAEVDAPGLWLERLRLPPLDPG
jgi:putative hydrolase